MTTEKEKKKKDAYKKALTAYGQAIKSFQKGDYQKSSEALKAFKEKYPDERELVDRANMYLTLCESRSKPVKVAMNSADDYYQHGVYKMNRGDFAEAMKSLEKAHQKAPKEGKILYVMAMVAIRMGDSEAGLGHLKAAVNLDRYFAILAQNESDFEDLREDSNFQLVTRSE